MDCIGEGRQRRGGLAMFWDESIDLKLQSFSLNHMDFVVTLEMGSKWRLIGFYGHPEEDMKC